MQDFILMLSEITTSSLITIKNDLLVQEQQEHQQDLSGDCVESISRHFYPYHNAIRKEMTKRGIELQTSFEDGLPF